MKNVKQALTDFIHDLELTAKQKAEATRQHVALRTDLQKLDGVRDVLISGSYARSTAIRPLQDIDLFVTLDPVVYGQPTQTSSLDVLRRFQAEVDALRPNNATPDMQSRSVRLSFSKSGISFDFVPAFVDPQASGFYLIPDQRHNRWVRSNPKVHKARSSEAHVRSGQALLPLVKAAKRWNYDAGKPLRSFHLEVMAWSILTQKPASQVEGLALLFEGLAAAVLDPCPDPAVPSSDLQKGVNVGVARSKLVAAGKLARAAANAAEKKDDGTANDALRRLFGPDYRY